MKSHRHLKLFLHKNIRPRSGKIKAMLVLSMSLEKNVCLGNPCKNGGSCKTVDGVAKCSCPQAYEGEFCQSMYKMLNFAPCKKTSWEMRIPN